MHSHLPAAIPEQALHWWCPDPTAEPILGDKSFENDTKTSSKSNFSQPSKNSLVMINAFSNMMEIIAKVITKWLGEQNMDIFKRKLPKP